MLGWMEGRRYRLTKVHKQGEHGDNPEHIAYNIVPTILCATIAVRAGDISISTLC